MITAEQHRRDARPEKLADVLEYEESLDPDDPSSTPVLRCCKSMVAWVRGSASLSRSKLFQMETLPECYIVHAYLCSDLGSITKLPDLMEKTILPKLKSTAGIDNNAFIRQLIGRKDFKGKSKFSGTIHCEASLMALVHMFSSVGPSEKRVHPFSEKTTRELKAIFSDADRVIGVAKKSCSCCYRLAELLAGVSNRAFLVPGTHGIVFPWTPPPYGVPVRTLEELERKLILKLTEAAENWITSQAVPHSSHQSSPVSDSSDGSNIDVDEHEPHYLHRATP